MKRRIKLFFIRHGQATFWEPDYDKLSKLGREQARALAGYFLRQSIQFEAVFAGSLRRHLETAQAMAEVYANQGHRFPEVTILPDFNEHCGWQVFQQALHRLAASDPELQHAARQYHLLQKNASSVAVSGVQAVGSAYRRISRMWVKGELDEIDHGLEPWPEFRERVHRGLQQIFNQSPMSEYVAVITSAGPVAATLGYALELKDEKIIELSWLIQNTALSEFRYAEGRLMLKSFNATPHLQEARLRTYV